ncbi:acyl-CoA dehydrogenase family protein [Hoeflea sp. G2-23]|uniref:Acyl-CoA dehydrogenase family protein n=1 Tax=Hoeflea algicola TaxID=2983763 RepID=A0ABT3ZBT1_9HYPH|nr:acyl-CoA dehydrogenase family protein [Hoeflea algicola]MCY0149255.1 acyl-CoA dehydrogenase family protein [Hoeflea algicola]
MSHSAFNFQDYNALSESDFRALVRRFLDAHHPPELRNPIKRLHWNEARPWYMTLSAHGWLAPGWPREAGGMGLSPSKQLIYVDEFERFGAARTPDHGIMLFGPLLLKYGTEAQKQKFLPRIIAGEDIWCQGYSEPNAGSDLASLRTQAVLEGDHWLINGQKTWTTLASDANWIFMLVRTDSTGKKQQGISFLLVPMDSPGVSVRPIINLDLQDEFCEVFFDNVRVPRENLVGEVNQGWTMAKALLGFERIFLGSPRQSAHAIARLKKLAEHVGAWSDPVFQDRYTQLRLDLEDHKSLYEIFADKLRQGQELGAEVSLLKIHQSELYQRISDAMLQIGGEEATCLEPINGDRDLNPAGVFLTARAATIYGGASEVQRNIISKNVLRLPDKPSNKNSAAWRDTNSNTGEKP